MMGRLTGKTGIITGAARGLGAEMAQLFVREGAQIIAADLAELEYTAEGVEFFKLNIADVSQCQALYDHAVEKFGTIDILINNAGITRDALLQKMTDDMWDIVIDVNLKGVFNLTRLVGPHMMNSGKGSIINISSIVGEYGNIGQTNYAATKAGVIGMTKTWAKELARKGAQVRVNAISPGYIMTDMLMTVPEELLKKFAGMTMLGRLGLPPEIAQAALFLASDEASYVTGHVLEVNGGMRL